MERLSLVLQIWVRNHAAGKLFLKLLLKPFYLPERQIANGLQGSSNQLKLDFHLQIFGYRFQYVGLILVQDPFQLDSIMELRVEADDSELLLLAL